MEMAKPLPAIFFGHGNPMNALMRNEYTKSWAALGREIPRAVLCVSAQWYLPGTLVTAMPAPRTIQDFGGFPRELYEVKYPAQDDAELANRVRDLLAPVSVGLDHGWGWTTAKALLKLCSSFISAVRRKTGPPPSTIRA
jgi:4,5-DOPA dioxygenase extradiol